MQDYFSFIFEAVNKILNERASFFEQEGLTLFRHIAVILVSLFGVQSALSAAEGGIGFSWPRFMALFQELLLVYTMLTFYTVPIPVIGVSVTHLVLDQVQYLTAQLDQGMIQEVMET